MTNPYEVPQAVLESEVLPMRKKTGWKVFFWVFGVLYIAMIVFMFFETESTAFFKVSEALVYCGVLAGLFCYAYNKRFLQRRLWKFFLSIAIGWDIYSVGTSFAETTMALTPENLTPIFIYLLAIAPVYFFQYFALYQYAFQSQEIWGK